MTEEIWKDIPGFENKYQVSNIGHIRSLNYKRTGKCKIMKTPIDNTEYLQITLCKNNKKYKYKVHQLVALVFIPNPNNYPQVNHKNEIKTDNRVENLEWCTPKYNNNYGTHNARVSATKKSKFTNGEYEYIKLLGRENNHFRAFGNQVFYCIEDDIAFTSSTSAAEYLKEKYKLMSKISSIACHIVRVVRHKRNTAYNKHFKLIPPKGV